MTLLQTLLGTDTPIIQAPMAGVQGSALAIAVSNAGGLGSLPCAMLTIEAMRGELAAIRAASSRPFNVNFFCHTAPLPDAARDAAWRAALAPYYAEFGVDMNSPGRPKGEYRSAQHEGTPVSPPGRPKGEYRSAQHEGTPESAIVAGPGRAPFDDRFADALAELRPPIVSFHFGLPEPALLARVRAWGAKVLASATTVAEARWLEAQGVDAVIAQGVEAGGHRGMFLTEDLTTQLGTFALLPQVVTAVRVPVIAAGGIADAAGVAAARALGAAGVQVGTAYLLCPEASTSALHRAALKSAAVEHTALTNLFTGRPARGIVNRLMRELGPIGAAAPAFPLATAALAPLRAAAERAGSAEFSPLWSGQNARGCREQPAAELTRALAAGWEFGPR